MTQVVIDIRVPMPDGTTAYPEGRIQWEPTHRLSTEDHVVLPRPFVVYQNTGGVDGEGNPVPPGPVTVEVAPTDGAHWAWKVTERIKPWSVRYVVVPDSDEPVNYKDLVDIDPDTLAPTAENDPVWWAHQQGFEQEIRDQIAELELGAIDPEVLENAVQAVVTNILSSGGSVHNGEGPPPDLIVGAKVGDIYIDTTTGFMYELEPGA